MNKKLTTFEASCVITGYGIGSGVLAMPYLLNKCGLIPALIIMLLSFFFSYLLHLMIADLSIKNGSNSQLVSIISSYLGSGKVKKVLSIILFALLAIVLYTNLTVYITGSSEILLNVFNIPSWLGNIIFYIFAAFVAMFTIKLLGICEKYTMYLIFLMIIILFIGSMFNINNKIELISGGITDILAFFGVSMFAFAAFFSVPQIAVGLENNQKEIKKSIFFGMLMNLFIILLTVFGSLLSSTEITEVCINGWSEGIGTWAKIIGSLFTILAMLTTYWSISMALKDTIMDATKLNQKISFLIASIPSLLISFIPQTSFMSFLEIACGAIAILIAIFIIPIFHKERKNSPSILGKFANIFIEILVFIAYILMAVGSIV